LGSGDGRRLIDRSPDRTVAPASAGSIAPLTCDSMDAPEPDRPLSAIPPVGVRIGAFVAIVLSGLAGGLIGFSLVDLQCEGSCALPEGIGLLVGAVFAAGGMAIVAVLVMRALGEWRETNDRERAGHAPGT
jgi:hypothetical protein